jgi:hypothetical protein
MRTTTTGPTNPNGITTTNGAGDKADFGLLWQKDPDSRFPFTEIRRACSRFPKRVEFRGWVPTRVYIHPDHADLLKAPPENYRLPEGMVILFDEDVPLFYIVVTGEKRLDHSAENGKGSEAYEEQEVLS